MINKYFFNYRNVNFMIYAKDIEDAFIPWKRLMGKSDFQQFDFEKVLIEGSQEILNNHCILVGNSLTLSEIKQILNSNKKSPVVKIESPKKIIISETVTREQVKEHLPKLIPQLVDIPETPNVKRGRGRPPGSKNKTVPIERYFEE